MEKSILTWLDRAEDLYQDKVAYRDGENTISFRDAAGISRAVGSCLTEYVQPQEAVAVLTGRSVMTPPCFFGVVRAGCFYAPMDATMPDTRLNQILSVIKAKVMIVDRENLEKANGLSFSGKMLILEEIIDTPVNEEALKNESFSKAIALHQKFYECFRNEQLDDLELLTECLKQQSLHGYYPIKYCSTKLRHCKPQTQ